jgi:CheY-like chemotaxis protein
MDHQKKLFLVVEDNPDDRFFLQRAFAKIDDCDLILLASIAEAKDYLSGNSRFADRKKFPPPSAIITDMNVRDGSGADLLQWIRSNDIYDSMPVALISGSATPTQIRVVENLRDIRIFQKPADHRLLKQIIAELCATAPTNANRQPKTRRTAAPRS